MRQSIFFVAIVSVFASAALAGDLFVYPAKNQSAEQQEKDEYECFKWAKAQSGVDPAKASAPAPNQPGEHARGTAGGALRGAAVGAVLGEVIDDDAGKGAAAGAVLGGVRGRRQSVAGQEEARKETASNYDKAYAVCLEARGYAVK